MNNKIYKCVHCGRNLGAKVAHRCKGTMRKRRLQFRNCVSGRIEPLNLAEVKTAMDEQFINNAVGKANQYRMEETGRIEREYSKLLMKLLGLKLGDIVTARFQHSTGTPKQSYTTSSVGKGIIINDGGIYFIESEREYPESFTESNGRRGKAYKSWWGYVDRKIKAPLINIKPSQQSTEHRCN